MTYASREKEREKETIAETYEGLAALGVNVGAMREINPSLHQLQDLLLHLKPLVGKHRRSNWPVESQ